MSKDETPQPLDLTGLEQDLARSFQPAWTREPADTKHLEKWAEGGDRDRGRRSGNDRGPRRPGGGDERRPRPARGPGQGGPRGAGERKPGGPGADRGRRGPDRNRGAGADARRGRGDHRGPGRPESQAPREPVLVGWQLHVQPDPRGIGKMAEIIKKGCKAFPLFDLARVVLEKPERYRLELRRMKDAAQATTIYQVKADRTLWLSESDAVKHYLQNHVEKHYRRERVAVEPPKGNFAFVAQCGLSGELLGPPNHHGYTQRLMKLHAEKFLRMSFEAFKAKIRMLKDEESMQKWKDSQSWQDRFFALPAVSAEESAVTGTEEEATPITEGAEETSPQTEATAAEAQAVVEQDVPDATVDAASAVQEDVEQTDGPAEVAETESIPTEAVAADEVQAVEGGEQSADDAVSDAVETAAEVAAETTDAEEVPLDGWNALEEHFRAHFARGEILNIQHRAAAPAALALEFGTPALRAHCRRQIEDLRRNPMPLAQTMIRKFTSVGLLTFKARKKITHVCVARPKYLDRAGQSVSAAVSHMLDYLLSHSRTDRPTQWSDLVELRKAEPGIVAEQAEAAMAADLSWLLQQGYVTDFINGNLQVTPPPQPQTPPASKPSKEKAVAQAEQQKVPAEVAAVSETVEDEDVVAAEEVPTEVPAAPDVVDAGETVDDLPLEQQEEKSPSSGKN